MVLSSGLINDVNEISDLVVRWLRAWRTHGHPYVQCMCRSGRLAPFPDVAVSEIFKIYLRAASASKDLAATRIAGDPAAGFSAVNQRGLRQLAGILAERGRSGLVHRSVVRSGCRGLGSRAIAIATVEANRHQATLKQRLQRYSNHKQL